MNIYESSEDYLERILILKKENGKVKSIDIAKSMNYSKPSISRAMKNLKQNGYITIDTNGYIELTEKGLHVANTIYERHTILSQYFTYIGVPQDIAMKDACKIEHVLSKETFDAIRNHINKYNRKQN